VQGLIGYIEGEFQKGIGFYRGNFIREKLKPAGILAGIKFREVWSIKYIVFVPREV